MREYAKGCRYPEETFVLLLEQPSRFRFRINNSLINNRIIPLPEIKKVKTNQEQQDTP